MKKYVFAFLCMFLFIPSVFGAEEKIYDDADLLTFTQESELNQKIEEYIENNEMDMILVTTLINPYSSPREFAAKFYDSHDFGRNENRDGILMLIDRSEGYNDVYLLTTGEAIRIYSDSRIESILDDIQEQVSNGYSSMFEAFIDSSSYYASLGVPDENKNSYIDKDGNIAYKRQFPFLLITILSLLVPSIIVGILVAKNKMVRKATSASVYLDRGSIQLGTKEDVFLHTHTTSIHIPRNTGSGGSGFSGGSHSIGGHGGGGRRM